MTRVDFYILPDVEADAKLRFACRLAMRALSADNAPSGGTRSAFGRVHVHVQDQGQARALDDLMWTYPDGHFIPHALDGDEARSLDAPVVIGCTEPSPDIDHVLVNLDDKVPPFFGRFERVVEIVVQPERDAGRERYRHYRDRGYPLAHHELDDWEA